MPDTASSSNAYQNCRKAAITLGKMIVKLKPQKVWSDRRTEVKSVFIRSCQKKNTDTYTTHSKAKSAFAKRKIGYLEDIIYNHLKNKWPYHYIVELQSFVQIINSKTSKITGLASNKVSRKHVSGLVSLTFEKTSQLVRKPKHKISSTFGIAKKAVPFRKKENSFTDELCTISQAVTFNSPTFFFWLLLKTKVLKASIRNQYRSTFFERDDFVVYIEWWSSLELHND